MADVPLAELHVHLEGTARPRLVAAVARRNGLPFPPGIAGDDDEWRWDGFLDFLTVYDRAAGVIRTPEDYRDITYAYLRECAAEGAVYVELMGSPDHAADVGLSDADHVAGIAQGIDDARAQTGIEARVVMIAVRNRGEAAAEAVARRVVAHPHPYVTGFGLAGDEAAWPPQRFARAFAVAHEAGLGLTVHAGEWAGPDGIRAALALPVTRLGHGVRAVEDPALVAELAGRGVVLEVCPSSNVATGIYPSWAEHPLGALLAAGVRVALGSDDPPYWGATIGGEYSQARRTFGLSGARLRAITRTALEAAFLQFPVRRALLGALAAR